MSQKITATHERVDDIPAIIAHLKKMRVAELLDTHFPTNGNWEGLSLGWTTVVWLAFPHSTEFSGGALRYLQYPCHFSTLLSPCLICTHRRRQGDETWHRPPK
jgi:hypothetical protein